MRIGVLTNLRAGKSVPIDRIMPVLRAHPDVLHAETENAEAVPEALATLAQQGTELLVVNGGDGTLQHTLTELLTSGEYQRLPLVAPLRGGRTNMTALDLGAHRSPATSLEQLIAAVRGSHLDERVVQRPVLRIETRSGRVRYGMFFGAGMIHRAISLTHRLFPTGKSHGVLGAGLVTASLITKAGFHPTEGILKPDKVQILLDGEMVPHGEFYLAIATSLTRLFLRMNPFWGSGPGPVRFTAVASNAKRVPRSAIGALRGHPLPFVTQETGYTSRNVEHAQLHLECGFTIDGEIFEPNTHDAVLLSADHRLRFVRA